MARILDTSYCFYQMTRLQVRKETVTGSVYILFLEPERFYIYGFFFFLHNVFYTDWNIHVKYVGKKVHKGI